MYSIPCISLNDIQQGQDLAERAVVVLCSSHVALLQLASIVGEFFTEADRVGPEAAAQFRFFLQEKARRFVTL